LGRALSTLSSRRVLRDTFFTARAWRRAFRDALFVTLFERQVLCGALFVACFLRRVVASQGGSSFTAQNFMACS